jgi:hypothetical protein
MSDKKAEASPSVKDSESTKSEETRTGIPKSPHYFDDDDTSGGDGSVSRQRTPHSLSSKSVYSY